MRASPPGTGCILKVVTTKELIETKYRDASKRLNRLELVGLIVELRKKALYSEKPLHLVSMAALRYSLC